MRSREGRAFYGWRIVVLGAIGMALTAPGQTPGISVFIDELIPALDLSRSQVSLAYLVGTLTGALAMPLVGKWIDQYGVRLVMAGVGIAFGAALVGMSSVVGFVTLLLGFAGIRMLGQGSLMLVSTTAVALWFDRRRGLAMGLTMAAGGALMSLAPLVLAQVISGLGWRSAFIASGVVVSTLVLLVAIFGMRNSPEDVGQRVDGDAPVEKDAPEVPRGPSWTRAEASRTLMFWAVGSGVAAVGLVGTGMQFHQISLLGEQGLSTTQAAANFIPQTGATIIATVGAGALADRIGIRTMVILAMGLLAAGMLLVQIASPGLLAVIYAVCLGAAGGSMRALEGTAFPRFFGVGHVGSIRGLVMSVSVGSTAFGPLALAHGFETTGSYVDVLRMLLFLPIGVAGLVWFAKTPDPAMLARIRGGRGPGEFPAAPG